MLFSGSDNGDGLSALFPDRNDLTIAGVKIIAGSPRPI